MLSEPSISNLIKSLGRETRAILAYTARSTFDGTILSHLRQPVTTRIPPPTERKDKNDSKPSPPHLPRAVRQPEEMKAISNGARPWKGDSWRANDKCKLSSGKRRD
ncbi:hypothetical protein CK203_035461 [Vitis vinifera]|uniref:Uncharacterized protein n=1 Tax=Vitis vinifera TaxID=29760 RepID=A0A438I3N1_VITVI|nr:hypothetical protein CK203_035461 [Vitis vinifera]